MNKEQNESVGCGVGLLLILVVVVLAFVVTPPGKKTKVPTDKPVIVSPVKPVEPIKPDPIKPVPPPKPCPGPCPCDKVQVLAFTATWCGPCQAAKPKLLEAIRKGKPVKIYDADKNQKDFAMYSVAVMPTFIILSNGKETERTRSVDYALSRL